MNPLKKLRDDSGLSLSQLSKLAKVDESTISKLENGHQKGQKRTLVKLAKALSISVEELASIEDTTARNRAMLGVLARQKIKKNEKTEVNDQPPT
jgi:transcriptional regulator with XRE-family HTH domain